MVSTEREIFIDVDPDIRIRYRRSESPPPVSYAIVLESLENGEWTTVRLWDNADAVDEHHEHEYTRAGGKQAPVVLDFSSPMMQWPRRSGKPRRMVRRS